MNFNEVYEFEPTIFQNLSKEKIMQIFNQTLNIQGKRFIPKKTLDDFYILYQILKYFNLYVFHNRTAHC